MDAHVTYKLHFGCSTYARKAKEISFAMEMVPYQNYFEIKGN
jgi:hypothetical protein